MFDIIVYDIINMCLIDQFQIFYNLEYLRLYEYLIISQFPVSPQIIYFRWLCVVHFGFCFQYKLIKDALISVFYTYIGPFPIALNPLWN